MPIYVDDAGNDLQYNTFNDDEITNIMKETDTNINSSDGNNTCT